MVITGEFANNIPEPMSDTLTITINEGTEFEIDFDPVVALEDVTVTFTGMVYHTNPPQIEIASIIGEYKKSDTGYV
ncbi:hypothetical protein FDI40_gp388 [Agrobacterium phage Atu_ph07]|uniref:Uncharacterized protein n=1 Tax=Agrobacterium phage Atu_ph07 TaxID=2024264 RepID=A0A2L0V036_9CAUD|nr:hypothetical protein FDI40_gp388 [Agrobacterium phage Atu_ph07]AUZ95147.1 hypothetical protein [Agrobacterium phage Atu_ph07]